MSEHKKPGRPRKRANVVGMSQLGIVQEAVNRDNCIELIYAQPQLLKCIVSIFQLYNSREIVIEFYANRVVFIGSDHSRNVTINISINATDMNRYYFSREVVARWCAREQGAQSREQGAHAPSDSNGMQQVAATKPIPIATMADTDADATCEQSDCDDGVNAAAIDADVDDETDADDAKCDVDADADSDADADAEDCDDAELEKSEDDTPASEKSDDVEEDESIAPSADERSAAQRELVFRVAVVLDTIKLVTSTIEKAHYACTIAIREGSDRPRLIIALSGSEYNSEDCFEIATTIPNRADVARCAVDVVPDFAHFPLEFTLDTHHLRRKIGELKKISANMQIRKYGSADLEIMFDPTERVMYTGTYRDASKIKLRSDISDAQTMITVLPITRIKPLMAVNMPGNITFFVNWTDPLVVQVGLDARADGHYAILARLLISTNALS